ncbi:MAG: RagB/SusD family nutrient uptake outer membrane protein [Bacteroidales bacterium]|nr:RagB/SusD family nutrient uptake outer membrane protein [Bacteroidales bacterium]
MKRIFAIIFTTSAAISCNFLQPDESVITGTEAQFSTFESVKKAATNVYSYLEDGLTSVEGTMRECATDDAVWALETCPLSTYYDGTWSATQPIDDKWAYYYKAIAAANYFLENCPEDFSEDLYNDNYKENLQQLKLYPYEVRFLRAYYHFELLRRYGNIVIADRSFSGAEANFMVQSSFVEVAGWIAGECDEIARELPLNYKYTFYQEVGRVTKGAAMALKARALLYAASPLNNVSGDKDLYLKAAKAACEIIKLGQYGLYNEQTVNNEAARGLIFGIRRAEDSSFEKANFPTGVEGSHKGINPSQNLVEAFDLQDGTPFDWNSGLHRSRMYATSYRDSRLARTVYFNGAKFKNIALETYYGGANGQPLEGATRTSYYLKKFIREDTEFLSNSISCTHLWPVFRYAEVMLIYAEALFMATGDKSFKGTLDGTNFMYSPLEAVNLVRNRSDVGKLPDSLTPGQFLERLKNEYRVEFAFEDHRYWDLRRWKDAPEAVNVYGLSLVDPFFPDTADKVLVRTSEWDDKMYYYPIPRAELYKNPKLKQNPGWE